MIINGFNLKSKNNLNVFLVSTDSGDYILHSDVIVKYGLMLGENDDKIFKSACEESEVLIATVVVNKYLNSRIKTEKQLKEYLSKKGFSKSAIEQVIDKLKEYKIIDDSEYAKAFIRSNANNSKLRLKKKLSQSGVDKKFIEQELENVDELESCFNSAKKFFKSKDINKDSCEKLTRRLSYQGYSWETIKRVLNKLTDIEFEDY